MWSPPPIRTAVRTHGFLLAVTTATFVVGLVLGSVAVRVTGTWAGTGEPVEAVGVVGLLGRNFLVLGVLLAGAGTLGVASVAILFVNGYLVGLTLGTAALDGNLVTVAVLVAPHGLLEYGAYVIAGAASLRLPQQFVGYLRGRRSEPYDPADLEESVVLVLVAVVLLLVGGVIELFVTPRLV